MTAAIHVEGRASQLWNAGARDAALAVLLQALALAPRDTKLLLAAGRACLGLVKLEQAAGYFQEALEFSTEPDPTRWAIAELLVHIGNQPEEALALIRPSAPGPAGPPVLTAQHAALLMELLDRTGREQEAAESAAAWLADPGFRNVLHKSPSFISRYGMLLGRRGEREAALELLNPAGRRSGESFDPQGPIRCLYAAARLQDAIGRSGAAWATVRRAHLLYAGRLPAVFKPTAKIEQLNWVRQNLDQRSFGPPAAPTGGEECRVLLMAGFPRSGTTLMQRILGENLPGMTVLDERPCMEPALRSGGFSPVLPAGLEASQLGKLSDAYFSMARRFQGRPPGPVMLDKMPGVTHLIPSYAMIFRDLRLIWPVRDPRDMLISGLFLHLPPNESTPAFIDPLVLASYIKATYDCWWDVRDRLQVPWMECRYEDLVRDPAASAAGLAAFAADGLAIDLNSTSSLAQPLPSTSPQALSPSYAEARRTIHDRSIGRWKQYTGPLAQAFRILDPVVRKLGYE